MYKPRREVKGEGGTEMSTLPNKGYLINVFTKGEGGQNAPNSVYVVCTQHQGLYFYLSLRMAWGRGRIFRGRIFVLPFYNAKCGLLSFTYLITFYSFQAKIQLLS